MQAPPRNDRNLERLVELHAEFTINAAKENVTGDAHREREERVVAGGTACDALVLQSLSWVVGGEA
jgi:hypothetical protein